MFHGAASQIRTGDLILTKDALYLLSYSSIFICCCLSDSFAIILWMKRNVKGFLEKHFGFFQKFFLHRSVKMTWFG